MLKRALVMTSLLLMSGCLWPVHEQTRMAVNDLAVHPFDLLPESAAALEKKSLVPDPPAAKPERAKDQLPTPREVDPKNQDSKDDAGSPAGKEKTSRHQSPALDVQTTSFMQGVDPLDQTREMMDRLKQRERSREIVDRLKIPEQIPGEMADPIKNLPEDKEERRKAIAKLYPELEPLPVEAKPLAGPENRPYTLSDLQQLAIEHSPTVQQAAADVENARGIWIQAQTYPNPTIGYEADTVGTIRSPAYQGIAFNQTIKMGGKLKLQTAAAEMDLRNAELALKRARFDLATQVRNAYYAHLVAREVMRVNKALSAFTDEVYRIQVELLVAGVAAPYEPASLRAQAYSARMIYQQSIVSFLYTWKQLVAAVNMKQMPLTEVAGRVDLLIPKFDFDTAKEYMLKNHTDLQMAYNSIEKARYLVKFNQAIPTFPDANLNVVIQKDYTSPLAVVNNNILLTVPIPIWDQNRGNILAAQSAMDRAMQEPARIQLNLINQLANNYNNYQNQLVAIEAYRTHILPDQVRAYRGIFERRGLDLGVAFADLVNAQQTLAAFVANYLTVLGQVWTSAIAVADLLQTDDLFQLGHPIQVPGIPVLETLPQVPRPVPNRTRHGEYQDARLRSATQGQAPGTTTAQGTQGPDLPPAGTLPASSPAGTLPEITRTATPVDGPSRMRNSSTGPTLEAVPELNLKPVPSS